MRITRPSLISVLILMMATLLLTASCDGAETPEPLDIDMRFREFYDLQGGVTVLGKGVTPIYNENGNQYQVVENGMMVYRPSALPGEQFTFQDLGPGFVTEDSTPPGLEVSGQTVLNGHVIYDEFLPTFKRMGEVRFVGLPLTEVRKNNEESRYEQYFEKLGFYRLFSDPPGTVRLLPYGLMECRRSPSLGCNKMAESAISKDIHPQPFLPILRRLENLPGEPLSQVYLAPDNKYEQIYENVVLAYDPENPRSISFRPLPESVGIQRQPAVEASTDPRMSFSETDNGLGYNVPIQFLEYISAHGGKEFSGPPITELVEINGLRRQCFTNYCLEYDPNAPDEYQIRPVGLGYEYLKRQGFSTPNLHLRVWESSPVIERNKTQVIGVLVYNQTPNAPVEAVQPVLTIRLDGEPAETIDFLPTSQAGTSFLEIPGARQAGLVEYQVCVSWLNNPPVCVSDSWLVQ